MEIKKLKELRRQRKLSQEQVARQLGVSRQTIFALEKGMWDPSLTLAVKICRLFDTALDDLFDIEKGGDMEMDRELMPWSPFRGLGELHREIDRFFDDSFSQSSQAIARIPAMNIHEAEGKYVVEAAVPGFKEDEIEIEAGEDYLTIKGEKKEEKVGSSAGEKDKKFHKREFSYGSFERTVAFPASIDEEKIEATLKDGTLEITIPQKAPAKPKVRKIRVAKK